MSISLQKLNKDLHLKRIFSITGLEEGSYEVTIKFMRDDEGVITLSHYQDCCEYVRLVDFEDDRISLTDCKFLSIEEATSEAVYSEDWSGTWTFYKIKTTTSDIWLRWLGESNGYYSESVAIEHKRTTHTYVETDGHQTPTTFADKYKEYVKQ